MSRLNSDRRQLCIEAGALAAKLFQVNGCEDRERCFIAALIVSHLAADGLHAEQVLDGARIAEQVAAGIVADAGKPESKPGN